MLAKKFARLKRRLSGSAGGQATGSVLVYLVGFTLQKLVPFAVIPIYTRVLPRAEYGLVSVCLATLAAVNIISSLGIDAAATRLYYEERNSEGLARYIYSSFVLRLVSSVLIGGLMCILLAFMWPHIVSDPVPAFPYVGLIAAGSALDGTLTFQQALLRAQKRAFRFVFVRLAQLVLQALIGVSLILWAGWGAEGPLTGYVVSSFLVVTTVSISFLRAIPRGTPFSWSDVRRNLSYGMLTLPQKIGNWFNNLSDRVILARFLSLDNIAIYQLGYSGGQLVSFVTTSLNNSYVPHYYEMKRDGANARTIVAIDCAIISIVGILSLAGALLAPEVIAILAPPSFGASKAVMPIIVGAYYMNAVYTQFLKEFSYAKRVGLASTMVTIPALLTVPMNLLAIPALGYLGAALVTMVSFTLAVIGVTVAGQLWVERTPHPHVRLWVHHVAVIGLSLALGFGVLTFSNNAVERWAERILLLLGFALLSAFVLVVPQRHALFRWFAPRNRGATTRPTS
ncbi:MULTISPECIES: lipopolysaccharide biosynthesis protein [Sphingomonas]|uniref:Oligosaccharide flippase family protein n=1 Tax=Sphingomonas molluscorum TaxID=418184 RepID=A0ABU8Q7S2_9SPHN|nr:oligosaccharide flippase family protein [Sphingomonas sp. JUb134]MBM7407142.1 O-antigen/teichoic acid export membrane protein [Sphingomonas sp. JUb134]